MVIKMLPMVPRKTLPDRTRSTRIPGSPQAWLAEIEVAYQDAAETMPFGPLVDTTIRQADLLHLAPQVGLKFRGIKGTPSAQKKATEAALVSYVATSSRLRGERDDPRVAFAFCYLAAHFGLDLLSQEQAQDILDWVEGRVGGSPSAVSPSGRRRTSLRRLNPAVRRGVR
jgi:hypothetical protein